MSAQAAQDAASPAGQVPAGGAGELAAPSPQDAAIGLVKTVRGDAWLLRQGQRLALQAGATLQNGDRVATGPDTAVGLVLVDDTRLAVGSRSELVLETVQFDPVEATGELSLLVQRGSVSMTSGQIAKRHPERVRLRTRSILLGVRGTSLILDAGELAREQAAEDGT